MPGVRGAGEQLGVLEEMNLLRTSCVACYRALDPASWSETVVIEGSYLCRECVTVEGVDEMQLVRLWQDYQRKVELQRLAAVDFEPEFAQAVIHTEPKGTAPMVNLRMMAAAQSRE
jgi:hypothetical protein